MNDYAVQILVARDRVRRVIERFGETSEAATLWGIADAIDNVDGTGRPATDAELAVVARALIGDL